ncbi:hypothetical protein SEA_KUWABARA_8 [Gordonia phage Kuwabara]|nr:hypothetical protein SEA_KUWABARA_8 [Gordonia phage Kuwabara]
MAKIRDDLEGVVYVSGQVLKAGDTIPDGVEVGDHLVAPVNKGGRPRRAAGDDN